LKVRDLSHGDIIASRAIILQQKTQLPVHFEIMEQTRNSISTWVHAAGLRTEDFLFPCRISNSTHLSTRQYARIVHVWGSEIGLDTTCFGTHTMRRTKPKLIYRRTKNLRAVQLLLGHSRLESAVRYLGIEVDEALEAAVQTEA